MSPETRAALRAAKQIGRMKRPEWKRRAVLRWCQLMKAALAKCC